MWKRAKTGVERHLLTVRVGVTGDEKWCINFPHRAAILRYLIPRSIKKILTLILNSFQCFTSESFAQILGIDK